MIDPSLQQQSNLLVFVCFPQNLIARIYHLPSYGASAPIVVLYIYTEMYNGRYFDGYPLRKAWDLEKLLVKKPQGKTLEEIESFLQSWRLWYPIPALWLY